MHFASVDRLIHSFHTTNLAGKTMNAIVTTTTVASACGGTNENKSKKKGKRL